jgi:hypothetical protein
MSFQGHASYAKMSLSGGGCVGRPQSQLFPVSSARVSTEPAPLLCPFIFAAGAGATAADVPLDATPDARLRDDIGADAAEGEAAESSECQCGRQETRQTGPQDTLVMDTEGGWRVGMLLHRSDLREEWVDTQRGSSGGQGPRRKQRVRDPAAEFSARHLLCSFRNESGAQFRGSPLAEEPRTHLVSAGIWSADAPLILHNDPRVLPRKSESAMHQIQIIQSFEVFLRNRVAIIPLSLAFVYLLSAVFPVSDLHPSFHFSALF